MDTLKNTYIYNGQTVNAPEVVRRVKDALPDPCTCRFCGGEVKLVSNADIYGREYGWPLTYLCKNCGAKVGCHPGTDIPLGTLADKATQKARSEAHQFFDSLWKGLGTHARSSAYQALSKALGKDKAHISWLDEADCRRVVEICKAGEVRINFRAKQQRRERGGLRQITGG